MKTMYDYSIRCTHEQTKKALELGAPITTVKSKRTKDTILSADVIKYDEDTFTYVVSPTAEQMVGWLEEQEDNMLCINILKEGAENNHQYFTFYIKHRKTKKLISSFGGYETREKCTIRAIDAALEYLTNNNK